MNTHNIRFYEEVRKNIPELSSATLLNKSPVYCSRFMHISCSVFSFQFNFVGKLLGPKGSTLKGMSEATGCKLSILGKGSMRDKAKVIRCWWYSNQGPVVQSIVCLTSSLVVKMLTVLVSTVSNTRVFSLKKRE